MLIPAFILGSNYPVGPCADIPSTIAMFIMMGTAIISFVLLNITIIWIIKKDKMFILPLAVHLTFWIGFAILLVIDSNK